MTGINIPYIRHDSFYVKHFTNEIFEVKQLKYNEFSLFNIFKY